jgi:cytochrome P450
MRSLARVLGQGLLTSEGEFWKRQRSLIQPAFHRQSVRPYAAVMNEIIGSIIQERRSSNQPREDLLDLLLRARDADGNPMSNAQLRDEVMTLFLAGHETTAIALSWACLLIAQNPDIETKLAAELQAVLGDRVPIPEDLLRLRYTEMVLKEAMRLYPAV